MRGIIGHSLAFAMLGALGLGSPAVSTERAVIPAERQDIRRQERDLDQLRRRMLGPGRSGKREAMRRQRQIAAGQLRAENGLVRRG